MLSFYYNLFYSESNGGLTIFVVSTLIGYGVDGVSTGALLGGGVDGVAHPIKDVSKIAMINCFILFVFKLDMLTYKLNKVLNLLLLILLLLLFLLFYNYYHRVLMLRNIALLLL